MTASPHGEVYDKRNQQLMASSREWIPLPDRENRCCPWGTEMVIQNWFNDNSCIKGGEQFLEADFEVQNVLHSEREIMSDNDFTDPVLNVKVLLIREH